MYINIIYKNLITRFFFKPSEIVMIYKGYFLQIIRDIYNTVNNWSSDISNKVKTKVHECFKKLWPNRSNSITWNNYHWSLL